MKKHSVWHDCLGVVLAAYAGLACVGEPSPSAPIDPLELIRAAGDAPDETLRFSLLEDARDALPPGDTLRYELYDLIEVAEHFAYPRARFWVAGDQDRAGEGGYLSAFFTDRVWPKSFGDVYPPEPRADSPAHALWCLYRGRMLIWQGLEHGLAVDTLFEEGRACLREFTAAHPNNTVSDIYLGEGTPWPITLTSDPDAPRWALLQREALVRLQRILNYWVIERQAVDGQFGGGWGDDVELWRRWTPLLVGFEHATFQQAQRRLAEGIFALPRLVDGYSAVMTDVEHSSEDTGDPLTALLVMDPNDAFARPRAERLIDLARSVWMAPNDRQTLQFRSTYFTATRVDNSTSKACDTAYHTRTLQPLMHLWAQGHEEAGSLLKDWLDTWVDVSARQSNNKPVGIIPSSIRFPSGEAGGSRDAWWDPVCHITPKTFAWPRAVSMMAQAMVGAALLSDDLRFLAPIQGMVRFWRTHREEADRQAAKGSNAWLAARVPGLVSKAISAWRVQRGDPQFDDLLDASESAFSRCLRTGDESAILSALEGSVAALSMDYPAYTSEVLYTDRAFKFHANYAREFRSEPPPKLDVDLLLSMLTGSPVSPEILGAGPFRWNTPVDDLAVWVREASPNHWVVRLYAFAGAQPRPVETRVPAAIGGARPWRLKAGERIVQEGTQQPGDTVLRFELTRGLTHTLELGVP